MKTSLLKAGLSLFLLLATAITCSRAQYIEDGLRLGAPSIGVGARSLGLGTAYTAVSNDYSAMYSNPAGLGLMPMNEFSIGMSNISLGNTSTYFGQNTTTSNSATDLNAAGLVYVVPTRRGSLDFAMGYSRSTDFVSGLSFQGFNPSSSIIQSWAPDGAKYGSYDLSSNFGYQLYLANLDTLNGTFISPIKDSLTQTGKVLESGGLNNWSFAGSIEAANGVYLGLTLNYVAGSYTYTRNYYEDDLKNIYPSTAYPYDFSSLSYSENLHTDIAGFMMKFGFMYSPHPNFRFGLTVQTPTWATLTETFSAVGTSDFKNGDHFVYPAGNISPSTNQYSVSTPWVFGAGVSFDLWRLTIAADGEYVDWSQLDFSGYGTYSSSFENYLNSLNQQVKDNLQPTVNLRGGAELNIQAINMALRAGAAYFKSPYQFDSSPNDQKYLTAGIGFLIEGAVALDIGYAYGYWKTSHIVYSGQDASLNSFSAQTSEDVHTNNIITTLAYRF